MKMYSILRVGLLLLCSIVFTNHHAWAQANCPKDNIEADIQIWYDANTEEFHVTGLPSSYTCNSVTYNIGSITIDPDFNNSITSNLITITSFNPGAINFTKQYTYSTCNAHKVRVTAKYFRNGTSEFEIGEKYFFAEPNPIPIHNEITSTNLNCGKAQFNLSSNGTNCSSNYIVNFGDGNTISSSSGQTVHTYSSNGTYVVTYRCTDDPNACPWVTTYEVTDAIKADPVAIYDCNTSEWLVDVGNFDPSVTYNFTINGTAYSYTGSPISINSSSTLNVDLNASKGSCSNVASKSFSQGSEADFSVETTYCEGEVLKFTNGNLPAKNSPLAQYQYLWTFPDGTTSSQFSPALPLGLPASHTGSGIYTGAVTLTLTNLSTNCVSTHTQNISIYPSLDAGATITPSGCQDGLYTITFNNLASATGYRVDFLNLYEKDEDGNPNWPFVTETIQLNENGVHTVQVKVYNDNCETIQNYYVQVQNQVELEINSVNGGFCINDQPTLTADIGNLPQGASTTYQWYRNGNVISGATNINFIASQGGSYHVEATVSSPNCSPSVISSNTVIGLEEPVVTVSSITGVSCSDRTNGSALLDLSAMSWNKKEVNGNTVNGNYYSVFGLQAGINNVTISHPDFGCVYIVQIDVPDNTPTIEYTVSSSYCTSNTGSITANTSATISSYKWYDVNDLTNVIGTTASMTGLAPGTYKLIATTDQNCQIETQPIVVQSIGVNAWLQNTNLGVCASGEVEVNIEASLSNAPSGYTPDYVYEWINTTTNTNLSQSGATATLGAGNYAVKVTDNTSGCYSFVTFDIEQYDDLVLQLDVQHPRCISDNNGSIIVNTIGGSGNFEYSWTDVLNTPSGAISATGYEHGNEVTIEVLDNVGCYAEETVEISALSPDITSITDVSPGANGACQVDISFTGGTPDYSYNVTQNQATSNYATSTTLPNSNVPVVSAGTAEVSVASGVSSSTSFTIHDLESGAHKLYIVDSYGCEAEHTFNVVAPTLNSVPTFKFVFTEPEPSTTTPVENEAANYSVLAQEMDEAVSNLADVVGSCLQATDDATTESVTQSCFNSDVFSDELSVQYTSKESHFTLYYYDRAGRLNKTIPPEGVDFLASNDVNAIEDYRVAASPNTTPTNLWPSHRLATEYKYNNQGQLIKQTTTDGGTTNFIYDDLNRLRFSQNAVQAAASPLRFSYTKYDELGRIVEAGEAQLPGGNSFLDLTSHTAIQISGGLANVDLTYPGSSMNKIDVVRTFYSRPAQGIAYYGQGQRYLRNRVSYTLFDQDGNFTSLNDQYATYYSYDPHGNVEWMVQKDPQLGKNYIAYDYDLISGNVLKVKYNEFRKDKFFHKYNYDQDNRITNVETSRDGVIWDNDAKYEFHLHGPMKRTTLGEDKVQGLDYYYTINGWLKSINTPQLSASLDPGQDGAEFSSTTPTNTTAHDEFGMVLGYYQGDYKNTGFLTDAGLASGSSRYSNSTDLYNGNISFWASDMVANETANSGGFHTKSYRYDQLNRIKQSTHFGFDASASSWASAGDQFKTNYTYDKNGNLMSLSRFDDNSVLMDDLTYTYNEQNGQKINNQLASVSDAVSANTTNFKNDLVGQHDYVYDEIGNLIKDSGTELLNLDPNTGYQVHYVVQDITWNVSGKVKQINKKIYQGNSAPASGATPLSNEVITFYYDASGNRVRKEVIRDISNPEINDITYYVRDASGNVMGVYERNNETAQSGGYTAVFKMKERSIYGSDRLGLLKEDLTMGTVSFNTMSDPVAIDLEDGVTYASEFKNWYTSANRSEEASAPGQEFCDCEVSKVVFDDASSPATVSSTNHYNIHGVVRNGMAIGESIEGELKFHAVIVEDYLGIDNNHKCLVFDNDNQLMKGFDQIAVTDPTSKPVVVKLPGNNELYALVTLQRSNKQPYYHIIDMSKMGYGSTNPSGEVILANGTIVSDGNTYGKHFTGKEDFINNKSLIYHTRYVPGANSTISKLELVAYEFGPTTASPTVHEMTEFDSQDEKGEGEIQISEDGKQLAYYNRNQFISAFLYQHISMHLFELNANGDGIAGVPIVLQGSQAGNYGDGSIELTADKTYYGQRGVYVENQNNGSGGSDKNTWAYLNGGIAPQPTTVHTGYYYGEIKRGLDGRIYIPQTADDNQQINYLDLGGLTVGLNQPLHHTSNSGFKLASNLPTQVYRVNANQADMHQRLVGRKAYELKDHLGNVRVVISDKKKLREASAGPNLATQSNRPANGWTNNWLGSDVTMEYQADELVIGSDQNFAGVEYDVKGKKGKMCLASFDITFGSTLTGAKVLLRDAVSGSHYSDIYIDKSGHYEFPFHALSEDIEVRIERRDESGYEQFAIDNLLIEELEVVPGAKEIGFPESKWLTDQGDISVTSDHESFTWHYKQDWDRKRRILDVEEGEFYMVKAQLSIPDEDKAGKGFYIFTYDHFHHHTTKWHNSYNFELGEYVMPFKAKSTSTGLVIVNNMSNSVSSNAVKVKGVTIHKLRRKGIVYEQKFEGFDGWRKFSASNLEIENGQLKVTGNGSWQDVRKDLKTEVGKYYKVKVNTDYDKIIERGRMVVTPTDDIGPMHRIFFRNGENEVLFQAREEETRIYVGVQHTNDYKGDHTYTLDNIEITVMEVQLSSQQLISNTAWQEKHESVTLKRIGDSKISVVGNDSRGVGAVLDNLQQGGYYALEGDVERINDLKIGVGLYFSGVYGYSDFHWNTDVPGNIPFKVEADNVDFRWRSRANGSEFTVDNMYLYQLEEGQVVSTSDFENFPRVYANSELEYNNDGKLKVAVDNKWEGLEYWFDTEAGRPYELTFDFENASDNLTVAYAVRDEEGESAYNTGSVAKEDGHYVLRFTPKTNYSRFIIEKNNEANGAEYFTVDNLTVRQPSGDEIIETFDNLGGWTLANSATMQMDAGKLKALFREQYDYVRYDLETEIGKEYKVSFDYSNESVEGLKYHVVNVDGDWQYIHNELMGNGGTFTNSFKATSTKMAVLVSKSSAVGDGTQAVYIDQFNVEKDDSRTHLAFDGVNTRVDLGNPEALQITGNMTIEMWLKPTDFNERRNPYAKAYGGEGTITQETNGTLSFYYGEAGANDQPYQGFSSRDPLTLNEWNHIAVVRDFDEGRLFWYINGKLTNTNQTLLDKAAVSGLNAMIGDGYKYVYAGGIDEFKVWNVARTAEQVNASMNGQVGANEPGLAMYYDFDAGAGNMLVDQTSNSNNGTLATGNSAPTWTATTSGPNASSLNFVADVISYNDYYPFGMLLPTRNGNSGEYRYGFNGKEKDDEVKGSGNSLNFGARLYDARVGRFFKTDNFKSNFLNFSPYIFAGNRPIDGVDVNGDSLYIIFHIDRSSVSADNEMFEAAALTRKAVIERSDYFDSTRDKVVVFNVVSMQELKFNIEDAVKEYSGVYGKTAEFSIFSHAAYDGPSGEETACEFSLYCQTGRPGDKGQMTMEAWGEIDFNFYKDGKSRAVFYGCNSGTDAVDKKSFIERASTLENFSNVTLIGQTGSAFPSRYTDVRKLHYVQHKKGSFTTNFPDGKTKTYSETYMVGGYDGMVQGGLSVTIGGPVKPLKHVMNGKLLENKPKHQEGKKLFGF